MGIIPLLRVRQPARPARQGTTVCTVLPHFAINVLQVTHQPLPAHQRVATNVLLASTRRLATRRAPIAWLANTRALPHRPRARIVLQVRTRAPREQAYAPAVRSTTRPTVPLGRQAASIATPSAATLANSPAESTLAIPNVNANQRTLDAINRDTHTTQHSLESECLHLAIDSQCVQSNLVSEKRLFFFWFGLDACFFQKCG